MRFREQLEEKAMVHQHYRSSERGKAGIFPLQQVCQIFLFSMTLWLSSDQSRTGVLHKKRAITTSWATTARRIQSQEKIFRYGRCQFSLVEEVTSVGLLAYKKTLMRCREELEEKVMVDQHYRSSERGKAGMFWLQQVFFFSMTSWLPLDHIINKQDIERFIGNM